MSEMVYGTTIGKEITYEKLFKMLQFGGESRCRGLIRIPLWGGKMKSERPPSKGGPQTRAPRQKFSAVRGHHSFLNGLAGFGLLSEGSPGKCSP